LRLAWFVKKTKPRSSASFSSTMRTDGAPSADAVASAIEMGSSTAASQS